jgi:hypothetical protein
VFWSGTVDCVSFAVPGVLGVAVCANAGVAIAATPTKSVLVSNRWRKSSFI